MTKWKCLSCGGTYDDETDDGGTYFHVCPENVSNPRNENMKSTSDGTVKKEGKGRKKV